MTKIPNIPVYAKRLLGVGLSIVPVKMPSKKPTIKWKGYQKRLPRTNELHYNGAIGLLCGHISGNIEVIDVDVKNFPEDKKVFLKKLNKKIPPSIVKKMVIQETPSGGLHLLYSCSTISRSQHLAKNKHGKPMIETRGEGAYIVIAPTEGYTLKQGRFEKIKMITPQEREKLFEACRSFNEKPASGLTVINTEPEPLEKLNAYIDALGKKDITKNYADWLTVMFGISHTFREDGREAMHRLCCNHPRYTKKECDKKFDECLKGDHEKDDSGKLITIGSVYRLIDEALPASKKNRLAKKHNDIELREQLRKHVFLIPSVVASNKFAHVIVDENKVCSYMESMMGGKASELCRERLAETLKMNEWPEFENEGLKVFQEVWIQKDTANECFLYFQNGTVKVTERKVEFIPGGRRPMIWDSLVLERDYKSAKKLHPIAKLAEQCVEDYEKFQIGIGYLLHRHWERNATKIVWAVDYQPDSQNDGRRGKDMFTKFLELCRSLVSVKWKSGHNFWTSNIKPDTAIVHFEDVSNRLAIDDEIKSAITSELKIEHKGENITTRKFADKPKFSASSQAYPLNYMDESIRARIWLIEFNDYLQYNVPKDSLVYGDDDLSPFDAWVISCIQCYLRNKEKLIGTPPLTDEQRESALKATYGSKIVTAVESVQDYFKKSKTNFYETEDLVDLLDCKPDDSKTIGRFKECYTMLTGEELWRVKRTTDNVRVYGYESK